MTGGAVLVRKTARRNAISIYFPGANSFTPERAFYVTKLPFRHSKFLSNRASLAILIFLEFRPAESGSFPRKSEAILRDPVPRPRFQIPSQSREMELPFHDAKFLPIRASLATVFFQELYPLQSRPVCPMTATLLHPNGSHAAATCSTYI